MKYILLTLFLGSSLLISCQKGQNACDRDPAESICIWTHASGDHPEGKMFQKRVDDYNQANPDKRELVLQNITRVGAGTGYIDKLNAAITAGNRPDIFTLDGPDVAAYAAAEIIAPFDQYIDPHFIDGFSSAMVQQGTYNNSLYAIGYQDSAVVVMYNEKMIEALPEEAKELIPSANEDWTWEELFIIAQHLQAEKEAGNPLLSEMELAVDFSAGQYMGEYELGTYFMTPLYWGNDASLVAADGLTVEGYLNSDRAIESLSLFGQFFEQELSYYTTSEKPFHNGKAAFTVSGFWNITDLINNFPDVQFRSLRYPKVAIESQATYAPSGSWVFVYSTSVEEQNEIEEITNIITFLTDDVSSRTYMEMNNAVPSRIKIIDAINTESDNPYSNEAWSVIKYQLINTNRARPISVGYPYLSEVFSKDILARVAGNSVSDRETIEGYLDEAIAKINREFRKHQ